MFCATLAKKKSNGAFWHKRVNSEVGDTTPCPDTCAPVRAKDGTSGIAATVYRQTNPTNRHILHFLYWLNYAPAQFATYPLQVIWAL